VFQGDVIKHGHAYKGTVATESGEEVGFKIIFVIPLSKLLDERYASSDVELTEKKTLRKFAAFSISRYAGREKKKKFQMLNIFRLWR